MAPEDDQPDEIAARIGANIRRLRDLRGLSQGGLAYRMGESTNATAISKWERGRGRPSWDSMYTLARVLNVDVSAFLVPVGDDATGARSAEALEQELRAADPPSERRGRSTA